jgi:hypothetical protein
MLLEGFFSKNYIFRAGFCNTPKTAIASLQLKLMTSDSNAAAIAWGREQNIVRSLCFYLLFLFV